MNNYSNIFTTRKNYDKLEDKKDYGYFNLSPEEERRRSEEIDIYLNNIVASEKFIFTPLNCCFILLFIGILFIIFYFVINEIKKSSFINNSYNYNI